MKWVNNIHDNPNKRGPQMGKGKITIDRTAKAFAAKIKKAHNPARVILFGSRAKGTELKHSDYDFIIVSDTFQDVHWLDRISQVLKHWKSEINIDVLPYTNKEFDQKRKGITIVAEAMKEGVVV